MPVKNLSARQRPKDRTGLLIVMPVDLRRRLETHCLRTGDRPAAAALDFIEQCLDEADAWEMREVAESAS